MARRCPALETDLAKLPAPWPILTREYLYRSPWRNFVVERLRTQTGDEFEYSYVEAHDAVFVVPLTVDGQIVLIRQYRVPVRDWVWEIPAGGLDGEPPEEAARRELAEEIGGTCTGLEPIGAWYGSPAVVRSRGYGFLATGVTLGESRPEPTEALEIVPVAAEQAFEWARTGRIGAASSGFALLLCEPLIRRHLGPSERPA
jgi:ADP-ribose pyrophosphatase